MASSSFEADMQSRILFVLKQKQEKLKQMDKAREIDIGIELMRCFVIDLLGGATSASAKIFISKFDME